MSELTRPDAAMREWTPDEIAAHLAIFVSGNYLHQRHALDIALQVRAHLVTLINEAREERDTALRRVADLERQLVEAKLSIILGEL